MAYLTDRELLERFEYYTLQVETMLLQGEDFSSVVDQIPFGVHLNDPETLEAIHVNESLTETIGFHNDEIREMGLEYLENHIHPETVTAISRILLPLYSKMGDHQTFSFIQYVRMKGEDRYSPLITFTKSTKLPDGLAVCLSPKIEQFGKLTKKIERVVEMDRFRLKHFRRFQQLTSREVEVLQLLANGCSNSEIAGRLFLSRQTVETHRKHLKRKLELRSFRDLMRYAFAFDLVEV